MSLLVTLLGGLSASYGLYKSLKGSDSKDKVGDILGNIGKYVDSLGLDSNSSPNYAQQAALQNKLNELSVQQQLSANKELANYEYNLNMASIREQNRYNDPSEQMKRLENAGLNPMLMYGNGATAATMGNQSEAAKYNAPQAERVEYITEKMLELQMMKQYQDVRLTQAQVAGQDLANEHARSVNRVALATEEGHISSVDIMNRFNEGQISYYSAMKEFNDERKKLASEQASTEQSKRSHMDKQNQLIDKQISLMSAQADKLDQETEHLRLSNSYDRRILENRVEQFLIETDIKRFEGQVNKDNVALYNMIHLKREEVMALAKLVVENVSPGSIFKSLVKLFKDPKTFIDDLVNGDIEVIDTVDPKTGEIIKEIIKRKK